MGQWFSRVASPGKNMAIGERDKVMNDFRNGLTTVLISTNLLTRGIDVLQVTLVVNYDLPLDHNTPDYETYIHLIGRTGRFGKCGVAINLLHDETSRRQLMAIGKHFNKEIAELPIDSLDYLDRLTATVTEAMNLSVASSSSLFSSLFSFPFSFPFPSSRRIVIVIE